MLEFAMPKIETVVDWSLVISFVGGISFYFGKLMSEASPLKEQKFATYVQGALFFILYIVFPVSLVYTFSQKYALIFDWKITFLLQFVLTWFLGLRLNMYLIEKSRLKSFVEKIVHKKTKEIYKQFNLKRHINKNFVSKTLELIFYSKIPNSVYWIVTVVNYWLFLGIALSQNKALIIFASLFMIFICLSVVAILTTWNKLSQFPRVIVHLDNGTKIEGDLTKIEPGFVNVMQRDKVYHIADSKILIIEKNLKRQIRTMQYKKK